MAFGATNHADDSSVLVIELAVSTGASAPVWQEAPPYPLQSITVPLPLLDH
jgi:hypothetical protein